MNKRSKLFLALSVMTLITSLLAPQLTFIIAPCVLTLGVILVLKKRKIKKVGRGSSELKPLKIILVMPKHSVKLKEVFNAEGRSDIGYAQGLKRKPMTSLCLMGSAVALSSLLVLFAFITTNMLFLILMPLASIPPLIPMLIQRIKQSSQRQGVEDELPFFSLLASALSHAGLSLARAFNVIVNSGIFKALSVEALLMRKESLFVGGDPITAMANYAQRHPSKAFSSLILGYTSILRSGGDVVKYLEEKTRELFAMLKEKWSNFVNHVSIMGEAMLALFLLTPLMTSMTVLVFASELNEVMYELLIFGVIPLLAIAVTWAMHIMRPQESFEYKPSIKVIALSISLLTSSFIALYMVFNTSLTLSTIVSVLLFATPLTVSYEVNKARNQSIESELARFLRYLGENKKLGIPLLLALERSQRERYNKHFTNFIRGLLSKMKLGLSLYQSVLAMKVKSRICKTIFFILDHLIASGGGSPATFEILASYTDEYQKHRAKVKKSLSLYSLLGYATPLILAICLSLTMSFVYVEGLSSISFTGFEVNVNFTIPQENLAAICYYNELMIIVASIAIGVILGKAVDGTLFSMRHLLICSVVALISLSLIL